MTSFNASVSEKNAAISEINDGNVFERLESDLGKIFLSISMIYRPGSLLVNDLQTTSPPPSQKEPVVRFSWYTFQMILRRKKNDGKKIVEKNVRTFFRKTW